MDIAQYISDLLNEHNEVSLPGIGTFHKKRVGAYVNEANGLLYPPSYKIEFNQDEGRSGLITEYIIKRKNISESSASYFLERFVENLKGNLENEQFADVTPLGKIVKTQSGLKFESAENTIGHNFFGLKPVEVPQPVTKQKSSPADKPVATTPVAVEETEVYQEEIEESKSGSRSTWVIISVLLLIAAVAAAGYFLYPQYLKKQQTSKGPKPKAKKVIPVVKADPMKDSITFADSLVKELEKSGLQGSRVEKAPDSVSVSSNKTAIRDTVKPVLPSRLYEIVVVTVYTKREATNSVKNLRNKGIDAKIVLGKQKNRFMISIGTFTDKALANKELQRIKQQLTKDAWLYSSTNKEN